MMSLNKQRIKKISWFALYILAGIFVIYYISKNGGIFKDEIYKEGFIFILFALLINTAAYGVRGLIWVFIVRRHYNVSIKGLMISFYSSEIMRYIPGNIWSVISRFSSTQKLGVKKVSIGYFYVVENLVMILTSFLTALLAIDLVNISGYIPILIIAVCLVGLLGILFLKPTLIKNVLSIASRKLRIELSYIDFKKSDLILIFLFFSVYWVLYGFAFYLITITLTDNRVGLVSAIGINAAAWLIGYLSFLTPSGIGVREGAFVLFLSRFTNSVTALSIAIIARLIFTFAEVIGLITLYLMKHFNVFLKLLTNAFNSLREKFKDRYLIALVIIVLLYISYFSILTIFRHYNLYSGRYDLGDMDQTVWNTIHGRVFEMINPDNDNLISRMAVHSDIMLILIAPLYWIYDSANTLLVLQSFVIGISAFPMYLIAKEVLGKRMVAFAFSLSLLLYPALEWVNLYDFHAVSFCIPLFLFAFYFIYKKKYLPAFIFCLFALITKEEIGLIVFMIGLYIIFIQKKYKYGAIFSSTGLFSVILFMGILIPHFRPDNTAPFALAFYSQYGDTPAKILKGMLLHPLELLKSIFGYSSIMYLFELLMPVGFLAILSPATLLLSISELAINILSNNYYMKTIYLQYTSAIIPFIFISAIFGYRVIEGIYKDKYEKILRRRINLSFDHFSVLIIIILALLGNYAWGILPFSIKNVNYVFKYRQESSIIEKLQNQIPTRFSVSASDSLASHFTHRKREYVFPVKANSADFIIVLKSETFEIVDKHVVLSTLKYVENNSKYALLYTNNDLYVFEKKGLNEPKLSIK